MFRSIKLQKIILVIFITVLIWVWADLAQVKSISITRIPVTISNQDSSLWVSFIKEDGTRTQDVRIEEINLKGPKSRMPDIKRLDQELELVVLPENEGMTKEGNEPIIWRLSGFLERNPGIRELGLKVESCKPESFRVKITRLVKKKLAIKCINRDGLQIEDAGVEPDEVEIFVPVDDISPVAYVKLMQGEIERARSGPVSKIPYVEIEGQIREALDSVKVRTKSRDDLLEESLIKNVKYGLLLTSTIAADYKVVIENEPEIVSDIAIRATKNAAQAYQNQPYHVVLVIDSITTAQQRQPLEYRFPPEFVRANEIKLNQDSQVARFILVPINASKNATAVK